MEKKHTTSNWKEGLVNRWEKMASTYFALKKSPSIKLILKFIILLLRIILSIIAKKVIKYFFPNF